MGSPYLPASLCVSLCISVCDVLPQLPHHRGSSPWGPSLLVNGASKIILVGEAFQCTQVIKIRCEHIKHQNRFVFLSKANTTIKLRLFSRGGLWQSGFYLAGGMKNAFGIKHLTNAFLIKKKMHTLWTLSVYKDLKVNARPWSMPLFEHACHKTMSNMLHCTWKGVNQIKSSKDFMKGLLNVLPFNTGDVTVNP